MAQDDLVHFPVTCPVCRKQRLTEFRRSDVIGALVNDRAIRLYAACCEQGWTAGYVEMQQIRAYLNAARPEIAVPDALPESRKSWED